MLNQMSKGAVEKKITVGPSIMHTQNDEEEDTKVGKPHNNAGKVYAGKGNMLNGRPGEMRGGETEVDRADEGWGDCARMHGGAM